MMVLMMRYLPFTCWALMALVLPWSAWTPLTVGAALGTLACWIYYHTRVPLRLSSAYADAASWLGFKVAPRHTDSLPAYRGTRPGASFAVAFLLASVLGAHAAAWLGSGYHGQWVPSMWAERFGDIGWLRLGISFWGGVLVAYGVRLGRLRPVSLAFMGLAAVCVIRLIYGGVL